MIVAQALTDAHADDAVTRLEPIDAVEGEVKSVMADAAYDTIAIYEAAATRDARVVVPPLKDAVVSGRGAREPARDRTVREVKNIGRRRWTKESGYHRQGPVENAFFRYKSILGGRFRVRHPGAMKVEAPVACNILNRMIELGRPTSVPIKP